jgi:hypothetical protein
MECHFNKRTVLAHLLLVPGTKWFMLGTLRPTDHTWTRVASACQGFWCNQVSPAFRQAEPCLLIQSISRMMPGVLLQRDLPSSKE